MKIDGEYLIKIGLMGGLIVRGTGLVIPGGLALASRSTRGQGDFASRRIVEIAGLIMLRIGIMSILTDAYLAPPHTPRGLLFVGIQAVATMQGILLALFLQDKTLIDRLTAPGKGAAQPRTVQTSM